MQYYASSATLDDRGHLSVLRQQRRDSPLRVLAGVKSAGCDVGPDGLDTLRRRWWLKRPVHLGALVQGMPDVLAEPVVTPAFLVAGGPRVWPAPGIPCALSQVGDERVVSLGHFVPRERRVAGPAMSRSILRDGASRLLRMRTEQAAKLNPHGEEPRSGVSNHEARMTTHEFT
jgi:hypothetical protein